MFFFWTVYSQNSGILLGIFDTGKAGEIYVFLNVHFLGPSIRGLDHVVSLIHLFTVRDKSFTQFSQLFTAWVLIGQFNKSEKQQQQQQVWVGTAGKQSCLLFDKLQTFVL